MNGAGEQRSAATWAKRLAWLVILWAFGVAVLGLILIALKLVMRLAGLAN
jgi:hypothetical protein